MPTIPAQDAIRAAADLLGTALPQAWALYLYGSFARGEPHPGSDVDLAVLMPPNVPVTDRFDLQQRLAQLLSRDVDLVDLRHANLDLVHQLLREGVPLLIRRPSEVLAWEAERMSDYADFNPRRADIVKDYFNAPLSRQP